jgi:hypothetical protein
MRFDREKELLFVKDRAGKEVVYSKSAQLPRIGISDVEIVFDGSIVEFNESLLRSLPKSIAVNRRAESDQFGNRKAGSSDQRFEYIRHD